MNWIMVFEIFLWIILSIIFLLFTILILPIKLNLSYSDEKWKIEIKILFLNIDILNSKFFKNDGKKSIEKDRSKFVNFKNIYNFFSSLKSLIKASTKMFLLAVKKISIENLFFKIHVGAEDCAKVSVRYGAISSVVYPVMAWIINFKEPKNYDISVSPDFLSTKTYICVNLIAKTSILSLIMVGIEVFKSMKFLNKKTKLEEYQ